MMQNTRIGEAAKILGVSTQTIRNWLALDVEKNFSSSALLKTKKRFTPFDIEQLQRIQALLTEGHFLDEIPVKLPPAQTVVEVIENEVIDAPTEEPQTNALQNIELFEKFIEQMRDEHKEKIASKDETIQAKNDLIHELREDKKQLQDELEHERQPWWKRLIS